MKLNPYKVPRKIQGAVRQEWIKLDVEIMRNKQRRQHIPVRFVLEDARWEMKTKARLARPYKR